MLAAGYMSWRTRNPPNSVWQAFGPSASDDDGSSPGAPDQASPGTPDQALQSTTGGASVDPTAPVGVNQLTIRRLRDVEPPSAPANGAHPKDDFVPRVSRAEVDKVKRRRNPAPSGTPVPHPDWETYATSFESDVRQVMSLLSTTPPTLRDLIGLFSEVKGGAVADAQLLTKYHVPVTEEALSAFKDPAKRANLDEILGLLRQQDKIASLLGPGASDPDLGSWYCRLMP